MLISLAADRIVRDLPGGRRKRSRASKAMHAALAIFNYSLVLVLVGSRSLGLQRTLRRQFTELNCLCLLFTVTNDFHTDLRSRRLLRDHQLQVPTIGHGLSVEFRDDVPRLKSGPLSWGARSNLCD